MELLALEKMKGPPLEALVLKWKLELFGEKGFLGEIFWGDLWLVELWPPLA